MSVERPGLHGKSAYERWLARQRQDHGCSGARGSTGAIDAAPEEMEALAGYFVGLSAADLKACWVACIVDAARAPFTEGELARALVVVQRRLVHGAGAAGLSGDDAAEERSERVAPPAGRPVRGRAMREALLAAVADGMWRTAAQTLAALEMAGWAPKESALRAMLAALAREGVLERQGMDGRAYSAPGSPMVYRVGQGLQGAQPPAR